MAEVLSFPGVQGSITIKLCNFLNLLTSFNQKSYSHPNSQNRHPYNIVTVLLSRYSQKIHKELLRINIMMSTVQSIVMWPKRSLYYFKAIPSLA